MFGIIPKTSERMDELIAQLPRKPKKPKFGEWQDIATAPRDGTFLVWLDEPDGVHSSSVGIMRAHPNIKTISGRFAYDMPKPLFWMPLPAPPGE